MWKGQKVWPVTKDIQCCGPDVTATGGEGRQRTDGVADVRGVRDRDDVRL